MQEPQNTGETPPYFSHRQLVARGWTDGLIASALGQPDAYGPNPHGPWAPQRYWARNRVEGAEACEHILAALVQNHTRRMARAANRAGGKDVAGHIANGGHYGSQS